MRNPNIIAALLLSLSLILTYFTHLTAAQGTFLHSICNNDNGNFTNNSTYGTNLNTVLSSITSTVNSTIYGYNTTSVGINSDTSYALVLCRGDVASVSCGQCINISIIRSRELCPNQREAITWYDNCMLRYSNRSSILTDMDDSLVVYMQNPANVTDVTQFNNDLRDLLDDLRTRAADGGPLQKFATGNVSGPDLMDIYGLAQCTPNLSNQQCTRCLTEAIQTIPICCQGRRGGRVITPSCNLRYEAYSFLQESFSNATPPSPPPSPPGSQSPLPPPPPGENDNMMRTVIIITVAIVGFLFLVVAATWVFISKRRKRKPNHPLLENVDDTSKVKSLQNDLETIKTATDNFSDSNKLGEGGFGVVYKGKLQNGSEIAVKRLSENSGQGDLEFKNEVVILAKVQHKYLVRLLGFCLEGTERILIYEFVPNGSLDHFIFDPVKKANMDWDRRYKIIGAVARGLLYLHEDSPLRIIHRDLKASNILLDAEMNPKIADFGMARLFERDETQGNTSRIAGTYGNMAPEYAMNGQFSIKSDVFSFGVLVLEIISGRSNNSFLDGENEEDLLSYAWKNWKHMECVNLIDPILRSGSSVTDDIMRCIHIGLLCVQENVNDRPTIASVLSMLTSFSKTIPVPSEPPLFMSSTVLGPEELKFEKHSSHEDEFKKKNGLASDVSINDC